LTFIRTRLIPNVSSILVLARADASEEDGFGRRDSQESKYMQRYRLLVGAGAILTP
jgi:hypothetical protein